MGKLVGQRKWPTGVSLISVDGDDWAKVGVKKEEPREVSLAFPKRDCEYLITPSFEKAAQLGKGGCAEIKVVASLFCPERRLIMIDHCLRESVKRRVYAFWEHYPVASIEFLKSMNLFDQPRNSNLAFRR